MAETTRKERLSNTAKERSNQVQTSTKEAWAKTKLRSKEWITKTGDPAVTKGLNKVGAETFWPTSLDRESDKAARILRGFCIDGFGVAEAGSKDLRDMGDMQVRSIPVEVIQNCRGLAIFTTIRYGFIGSRAGGSGIVIAKRSDGGWSPPSAIGVVSLGVGLQAGADIYDCVCVINNEDGMEGFTTARVTLGGEVGTAAGPLGGGAKLASEVHKRQAPVWTYTRARGLYAGVQVQGTVIVERSSENERFYEVDGVKNTTILAGEVEAPSGSVEQLMETLKAIQDDPHDKSKLPQAKTAPDDQELEPPKEGSEKEYNDIYPEDSKHSE